MMKESAGFMMCDHSRQAGSAYQDGVLRVSDRLAWAYYWYCKSPRNDGFSTEYAGIFSILKDLFDFETGGDEIKELLSAVDENRNGACITMVARKIAALIHSKAGRL